MRNRLLCGLLLAIVALSACHTSPQSRRDKYLTRGKQLLDKRDYARALLEFKNASTAMPRDAAAYYYAGLAFAGMGDLNNAALSLDQAVTLDPNQRDAKVKLAELMTMASDDQLVSEAAKTLAELAQTGPATPELLNSLAVAQLKLGNVDDAIPVLEQGIRLAPANLAASFLLANVKLMQHDPKAAEDILKRAAAGAPDLVEAQLALGRLYVSQKRTAEAEQIIRQAVQAHPSSLVALHDFALLLNSTGRKQEAEATFKTLSTGANESYKPLYGFFLFSEGRRDEAVREFERLANAAPRSRVARTRLVMAYQAVGRPADARRVIEEALKKSSTDVDALLQRAQMSMAERQYNLAEADLSKLLKLEPNTAQAHYWMAKLHHAQGQSFQYRQGLLKALELDPAFLAARLEAAADFIRDNKPKAAIELLDQASTTQKKSPAVISTRNWALWAMGDMQQLRTHIDEGLATSRTPEFLIQDGLWKLQAGKPAEARTVLEEALQLNPADVRALTALKDSYVAQHQLGMAVEKVREYAGKQTKSPQAQQFLGFVLWGGGDRAGARAAFTAAKAADPRFYDADLALVQLDAVESKWDEATSTLKNVVAASPENGKALLWLGIMQWTRGDKAVALDYYRKAAAALPDNAQALNNFAYALSEKTNQLDEALALAQKAVEKSPTNPEYTDTLGWILYRKGLYSEALRSLEHAAAGSNPIAKYHLAMAYAQTGNMKRGRVVLDAALKQNPKLAEAQAAATLFAAKQ